MQRRRMGAELRGAAVASVLCLASVVHAHPSADQVLTDMGFSPEEKERVLKGEFINVKVAAVSERDLSFAIAFLIKTSPDALCKQVLGGTLVPADPQVQAYGALGEPGSPADFQALQITDEEAHALATAEAGDEVNLSADEHASFKARRGAPAQAVQEQLHRMLLARYQSYRASGLAGVAPYDRGGGRVSDLTLDLEKASQAAAALRKYVPALQAVLLDYPKATIPGMEQRFLWLKSIIRAKATYVLAHILAAGDGDARAVVRREFYVSTGYNAEQSIAGFLPVEGGTIVVYVSHAFTDQVAGAAGSTKRSIGSRIMASQMKAIFDRGRKSIERSGAP